MSDSVPNSPNSSSNEVESAQNSDFSSDSLAAQSDEEVKRLVGDMFNEHRERLLRMIEVRLQPQLRARVDANDVLQESFIEAYRQLRTGVSAPKGESIVWLRLIVGQQLVSLYRKYCQAQKRNVTRERSLSRQRSSMDPESTSIFLTSQLTSPSVAARRHELTIKMKECLERLDPADREIISLRHFEQLTNREAAEELGVAPNSASVMYLRALKRFRVILEEEQLDQYVLG